MTSEIREQLILLNWHQLFVLLLLMLPPLHLEIPTVFFTHSASVLWGIIIVSNIYIFFILASVLHRWVKISAISTSPSKSFLPHPCLAPFFQSSDSSHVAKKDPVFTLINLKRLMPLRNSSPTRENPVINKQT